MRPLLVLAALLLAFPATAADWSHYVNERFGVAIDVPPGFALQEPGPENGDGNAFRNGSSELRAYGSLMDGDFEAEVANLISFRSDDGWTVTYRAVTQTGASFSGKKDGRIFYQRAIPMCGGDVIGAFDLEYSAAELTTMPPVIERLVASLADSGTGWQC